MSFWQLSSYYNNNNYNYNVGFSVAPRCPSGVRCTPGSGDYNASVPPNTCIYWWLSLVQDISITYWYDTVCIHTTWRKAPHPPLNSGRHTYIAIPLLSLTSFYFPKVVSTVSTNMNESTSYDFDSSILGNTQHSMHDFEIQSPPGRAVCCKSTAQ